MNRGNFDSSEEWSVLPTAELLEHLQLREPSIVEKYYRQLDRIIIESINSTNKLHKKRGCFELFGFDVLLDANYRLWLLEVNLSPACEARTPWLDEMLGAMSEGLLTIVLPKHLAPPPSKDPPYHWKLIFEEKEREPTAALTKRYPDLEGSLIKEVRRKVAAKRLFVYIVEGYLSGLARDFHGIFQ